MLDHNNYYHVDPDSHQGDLSGRYPQNYARSPFFLKPLVWGDILSRRIRRKPAYLLGDRLLKIFDSTGPLDERWGTQGEINDLREIIALFNRSLDENPYVSPIGRILLRRVYGGHLKNRAETIAFYEKNRQFIEKNGKYKAPLIVTGFARTGSTLLYKLLSQDPNSRSPYTYELEITTPPLQTNQNPMKDPRLKKRTAMLTSMSTLAPGALERFAQSHPTSATDKEEAFPHIQFHCGLGFLNCMTAGLKFAMAMHHPAVAPALFKYENNFFKMLDAYCPAKVHWVNKSPAYAPYFGYIFATHPDANVVVMHRDPSECASSFCRLLENWHILFDIDGSFDKLSFGRLLQKALRIFWSSPLEWRERNPKKEPQITDVFYENLLDDPISVVRSLYEKFGMEYTREFENRMKDYLNNDKHGKSPRHKYTNEEYGIDPKQLFKENEAYFRKYGYSPKPKDG